MQEFCDRNPRHQCIIESQNKWELKAPYRCVACSKVFPGITPDNAKMIEQHCRGKKHMEACGLKTFEEGLGYGSSAPVSHGAVVPAAPSMPVLEVCRGAHMFAFSVPSTISSLQQQNIQLMLSVSGIAVAHQL